MFLTEDPIRAEDFLMATGDFKAGADETSLVSPVPCSAMGLSAGASVLFLGIVRDLSQGKKVLYLEYEAYEAMAERAIAEVIARATARWPLESARVLHRLGKLGLGEIAVALEVRSAHRDAAYLASRFLIERIKHDVPIWKKEFFADGTTAWGLCKEGAAPVVLC